MATYTDNYNLVKPTMAESADIRTINGNMDSVDNIMHATQVSLANAYDSNETYNTGDIVMYEFLMYECLDDDVTGTWDATKWQRTTAGEHGGGGGGSDVEITPTLQSGTKIADFEINGVSGALYAPNGGGGGGGSDGVIEGLDYDRAETLTMPDYTGYTYTPTEDGVLMLKSYGSVGGVSAEATGYDTLMLSVLGDTWTCPWIPVNKGTEYTLKRMAQSSGFPSDSWFKFIPWKRGVFLAPMIYSTEEREVGAWVDDKPLYTKTVSFIAPSGSGNHTIMDVSGLDIDSLVNIEGKGSYQDYLYTFPTRSAFFAIEQDYLMFNVSNDDWGSYTMNVTLYYTKTSDVAGSGSYGSLGVPMEHYDDTERVVGTYFGETLYQKTIPNISITGTTNTIQTGENIGSLVSVEASGYKIDGGGNIIRFRESYNDGGGMLDVEGVNNDIRVICSSWFNGSTMDITIKYTKSTT